MSDWLIRQPIDSLYTPQQTVSRSIRMRRVLVDKLENAPAYRKVHLPILKKMWNKLEEIKHFPWGEPDDEYRLLMSSVNAEQRRLEAVIGND